MGTQFCEKQVGNPGFPAATLQCSVTDFVGMERQLQRGSEAFQKIWIPPTQIGIEPSNFPDILVLWTGQQ